MAATMTPTTIDLEVWQGATWRHTFTCEVGSPYVPLDLTGYSARMEVRQDWDGCRRDPMFTLTDTDGLTLGGAAGTIIVEMSAERTEELETGNTLNGPYVYDILIELTDSVRVVQGSLTVYPRVTRAS